MGSLNRARPSRSASRPNRTWTLDSAATRARRRRWSREGSFRRAQLRCQREKARSSQARFRDLFGGTLVPATSQSCNRRLLARARCARLTAKVFLRGGRASKTSPARDATGCPPSRSRPQSGLDHRCTLPRQNGLVRRNTNTLGAARQGTLARRSTRQGRAEGRPRFPTHVLKTEPSRTEQGLPPASTPGTSASDRFRIFRGFFVSTKPENSGKRTKSHPRDGRGSDNRPSGAPPTGRNGSRSNTRHRVWPNQTRGRDRSAGTVVPAGVRRTR